MPQVTHENMVEMNAELLRLRAQVAAQEATIAALEENRQMLVEIIREAKMVMDHEWTTATPLSAKMSYVVSLADECLADNAEGE